MFELGPVVQSIVNLTKVLGKGSLSHTVHTKFTAVIFFAEKLLGAFVLQMLLIFFQQKCQSFAYIKFET